MDLIDECFVVGGVVDIDVVADSLEKSNANGLEIKVTDMWNRFLCVFE